jgi:serine/threonine-protein kinase
MSLVMGTMVGEYKVDRKLGSGSFGDVYAGEHPLIGKRVAIKVLRRQLSADPKMVARFIAEARAVNLIRHRNIIDIFSFGQLDDGRHYFVMDLLDGLTLGALLEHAGRLDLAKALPIARGIADALDAAHRADVVHRDLKPDNVFLVTEDGAYSPKLLDFGVAKLVTGDAVEQTANGVMLGTPRYMSPEQARGRAIDFRTDVYALGVVIHEMLTGQPPFSGSSSVDLLYHHVGTPPPRMSSVCADLPAELDEPVLAMLAKQPQDRPRSAGEGVAALVTRAAGAR